VESLQQQVLAVLAGLAAGEQPPSKSLPFLPAVAAAEASTRKLQSRNMTLSI